MKKTYKKKEEKLTSEGAELRQPVAELEAPSTYYKQAEKALQAEKNKLQSVIDAIEYGLTIQDKGYNVLYQSQSSRMTGGYHLGEKCYRAYEGRDKLCDGCPVEKAFRDGKSHTSERKVVTLSGEVFFLENTASPVRDAEGRIVSCVEIGRDVTKRKQAGNELRKFKAISDKAGYGISIVDLEGNISYVNPSFARMLGYTPDELIGQHLSISHTEQQMAKVNRLIEQLNREGSYVAEEVGHKRKDNTELTTLMNGTLIKDENGTPLFMAATAVDITGRKQSEEREKELQRELYLSSRLAAIGELAAGIAHQINNPLTGVLGFSQRLLRKSTDQETNQDLKRIYTEAERAAKVVQNLLTFARRRQPQKQYSYINEILVSALELRAYELNTSNIEVVTDLAPSLPELMLDFQQIQEVFLNIILNAEQAITEANGSGKLTIKTEERKVYIRTTFTDNGPGIPAENLEKIFDPFFSTKGEKGGTGLGLSVCHGIMSEHGGRIYAKSKPGKGATFFVELPLPEN